jgi:hypothetical protein
MEEMDASLKQYVIGYIAIVTPIALSILFMRRGPKAPVQLRLKNENSAPLAPRKTVAPEVTPEMSPEISINAFFNWNGHLWDAYEALGIPAGSSLESVKTAYQRAITGADDNTKLFFKAAFEAITRP